MRKASLALALFVAIWVPEPPAWGGVRQWDGGCDPNVDWDKVCDGVSTTNWDQDPNLPQPTDSVNVPSEAGQTILHSSFELQSVTVGGSLLIDGGDLLTVHDNSTISNLSVSGGGIQALDDATVTLLGNTSLMGSLKGDGTAGQFQIVDQYLGGGVFELGAQVTTLGTATVSSNMFMHHTTTEWINQGSATLTANITTSAADTADIINQNNFTVLGGQQVEIRVDFINQGGTLELQESGTILALKSHVSQFMGGTLQVLDGTTLKLQALNGLPQVHEFGNSPTLTGAGWIDVIGNPYDVTASLTTGVGVGAAVGGTGGFRLTDATLFVSPGIDIRNTGRFSFVGGTIAGGGKFINESEAFTTSGSATFGIDVVNKLNLSVLCCSIIIGGGKNFENDFDVLVHGGIVIQDGSVFVNTQDPQTEEQGVVRLEAHNAGISGAGVFANSGGIVRLTVGANEAGIISSRFSNSLNLDTLVLGIVHANSGTLVLQGDVTNLDDQGVLTLGVWKGGSDGIIDFPRAVTALGDNQHSFDTMVVFDRPQPDFESLRFIRRSARAIFTGGQSFVGSIEITDGGQLQGGSFTVQGRPAIREGGRLTLDLADFLFTPEETDVGDGVDSITPELAGGSPELENLSTAGRLGPPPTNPLLITAKLNNRGRVLPGDRQDIGTLEVQGDYEQYSMGRLHIETVSGGNSDLLDVVGDVILDGELELGRIANDDPEVGLVYTILTTTGGLAGAFSSVDTFDTVQVIYNAQSVDVVFDEVTPVVFADDFESGDTSTWSSSVP